MGKSGSKEVQETSQEVELSKIANEQWLQYQTRFKPFEDEWISNIRMGEGDQKNMAGQVNAGVGSEFDKAQSVAEKTSLNAGMDPSSGRYKAAVGGLTLRRGAAQGKAQGAASQAVDDQTYQGLQQAIAMGRGQSAEATRDMTSLAYDATGKAISDEKNRQDTSSTWASSAMSAAGMGLAGWKNAGSRDPNSTWYQPKKGDMMTDPNTFIGGR